ncbi:TPA: histidine kinase, partial [Pseudomonas aeruginosa]
MIRFCPNCQSERSLSEIFCEGSIQGQPCGWDLSAEAIHPAGWRPQPVLTQEAIAPPASEPPAASAPLCANGHPLQPGDLMCLECGAAPAEGPLPMQAEATPQPAVTETLIDGWRLLRQIASSDGVRERYLAEHAESARQAVLTLYRPGAEPDPAIYDVIRRLPREHVPEILATGRWDERAYEVVEELTGGSLADLGTVLEDREAVRHVVRELGHALHVFNE